MNIRSTRALAASMAATAGLAMAATADASRGGPHAVTVHAVTVAFHDLDLSQQEGVATLYGRLSAAARAVCGPVARELKLESARRQCVGQAMTRAVRGVDRPLLSLVHETRSGLDTDATRQLLAAHR